MRSHMIRAHANLDCYIVEQHVAAVQLISKPLIDICLAFFPVAQSDLKQLSEIDRSLAIFCVSTYGEGDPTDNSLNFIDWLKDVDDTSLEGIKYAVRVCVTCGCACTLTTKHLAQLVLEQR